MSHWRLKDSLKTVRSRLHRFPSLNPFNPSLAVDVWTTGDIGASYNVVYSS